MSCWRPYCAVGVPPDENNICWQVSTISGNLVVASLHSAANAVMFLLSLLLLASLYTVAGFNIFASIPAFDGVHTLLAVLFLLSFLLLLAFLLL
jgi:hypothetical protein